MDNNSSRPIAYKVLVIGAPGVGKTSLIRRYVNNVFSTNYKATIGVDFALKIVEQHDPESGDTRRVHLQLWDISGQDRYGVMTRVYYKDAYAAVVVLDVGRKSTWESAAKWKDDLDAKIRLADGGPLPTILLANKSDLVDCELSDHDLEAMRREHNYLAALKTSAKDGLGVESAFQTLIATVMETDADGRYEMAPNFEITAAVTSDQDHRRGRRRSGFRLGDGGAHHDLSSPSPSARQSSGFCCSS